MTRLRLCDQCMCRVSPSECVTHSGGNGDNPFEFEFILDPDDGNLATCGPQGAGVFLPTDILYPPVFQIYRTVRFFVHDEAAQLVPFNEVRYDTDNMIPPLEDEETYRATINTSGVYYLTFNCTWNKNEDGDRAAFIRKNGADFLTLESKHAGDADLFVGHSLSCQEYLEAGEYVEVMVKQDSGTQLALEAFRYSPVFAGSYMRPAP